MISCLIAALKRPSSTVALFRAVRRSFSPLDNPRRLSLRNCYSDRRKLTKSCWFFELKLLKFVTAWFASEAG